MSWLSFGSRLVLVWFVWCCVILVWSSTGWSLSDVVWSLSSLRLVLVWSSSDSCLISSGPRLVSPHIIWSSTAGRGVVRLVSSGPCLVIVWRRVILVCPRLVSSTQRPVVVVWSSSIPCCLVFAWCLFVLVWSSSILSGPCVVLVWYRLGAVWSSSSPCLRVVEFSSGLVLVCRLVVRPNDPCSVWSLPGVFLVWSSGVCLVLVWSSLDVRSSSGPRLVFSGDTHPNNHISASRQQPDKDQMTRDKDQKRNR